MSPRRVADVSDSSYPKCGRKGRSGSPRGGQDGAGGSLGARRRANAAARVRTVDEPTPGCRHPSSIAIRRPRLAPGASRAGGMTTQNPPTALRLGREMATAQGTGIDHEIGIVISVSFSNQGVPLDRGRDPPGPVGTCDRPASPGPAVSTRSRSAAGTAPDRSGHGVNGRGDEVRRGPARLGRVLRSRRPSASDGPFPRPLSGRVICGRLDSEKV
jgi:hypothetical protein